MNGRWTSGVRRHVLPNGLTLLIQRDASAPVAAVVTHVEAGFFDEPDRWMGISHVLEHMFFKGTVRRGPGAIARETKAAGGYLNASTTYDHTSYFVVLPSANLQQAIDIQSDALINSVIDPEELARELQVIIQEAKRKLDSPSAVTHETLHEVMFDVHRIRRWRIGYESQLAGFTRDDLWGYYRSRYVPERTIVSIVGDVDEEQAYDLALRAYGDWTPAPGAHDPSPLEPARRGVRTRTLRGDVTQAELTLGWRGVPALHPDSPALDLAAAVLSSGRGSWLYRALRESGLVTSVGAYHYAPTELGVFSINADFDAERLPLVIERTAQELARLALLGPDDADLERARTLLLTRWARRMESMDGRASALAAAEALDGVEFLDREYAALEVVTPEQVRDAVSRYLQPDLVSAVAYLPRDRGQELTTELIHRTFEVTEHTSAPPRPAPAPHALLPVRSTGLARFGVRHTPLPGVDLLVRRKPGVPTVTLGIYVPRSTFDPPAKAGLGALIARSSLRGAGALDAASLAFAIERLGGTLASSVTLDWLGFSTTVLCDRLGEAAVLLDQVFTAPALGDEQVVAERALLTEEAQQVADDMFRYPFQLAFREAFGEQGYGLPALGLPETLPGILPSEVRAWHETVLLAERPVVVAVGDLDEARASDVLAGVFARYPSRAPRDASAQVAWLPDRAPALRTIERQKTQSALAMAFPGPSRRSSDRFATDVWAAVASGLGGRLFEALRDRRSLAYTVLASAWQKARGGAIVTYIATSPDRETEAREAMLRELALFAEEGVSDVELDQAVNYLAGQAEVDRQSGAAISAEILEAWLAGVGLEDLEDPGASYRRVSAEQVRAVARRYLRPERRAEGLIRGTGGGR
jgi:zinc protease